MTSPRRSQRETGSTSADPRRRKPARLRPRPELRAARTRAGLARRAIEWHRARRVALAEPSLLPSSGHEPARLRATRFESRGLASGGGVARLRGCVGSRSDGATPTRDRSAPRGNQRARQSGPRRGPRRSRDRTRPGARLHGWRLRAFPRPSVRESVGWTDGLLRAALRRGRSACPRRQRPRCCSDSISSSALAGIAIR